MLLISHRGNMGGKIDSSENKPSYIDEAISEGYDVEVDVWFVDNTLYLGHDRPQYVVDFRWIRDRMSKIWIHCKNIEVLEYFKDSSYPLNYFWHQEDDVTITSLGYFWTYPGKKLTKYSIAVLPDVKHFDNIDISYGICSDYIKNFK